MLSASPRHLRALFTTAALCMLGAWCILTYSNRFTYGGPGTQDFIQYWSAFRVLEQGGNPYNGVTLHALQTEAGQLPHSTILMWNPPWTALYLSPFGALPFPQAACAWFLFSIIALVLIAGIAPRALDARSPPRLVSLCGILLFRPVLESLALGQLGILLALACTVTLYFIAEKRFFAAGATTCLVTIKPHLFFLLAPLALVWLGNLNRSERRAFLVGCGSMCLATLALTYSLWPHAIGQWLGALGANPVGPGVVPIIMWKTATLPSLMRIALEPLYGYPPLWPLTVIPLLSLVLVAAHFFKKRRAPISIPLCVPPLLCLSLFLCNYGWLFDQSILVVCQLSILYSAWNAPHARTKGILIGGLLAILGGSITLSALLKPSEQHHFAWIPLSLLLLFTLSIRLTQKEAAARL